MVQSVYPDIPCRSPLADLRRYPEPQGAILLALTQYLTLIASKDSFYKEYSMNKKRINVFPGHDEKHRSEHSLYAWMSGVLFLLNGNMHAHTHTRCNPPFWHSRWTRDGFSISLQPRQAFTEDWHDGYQGRRLVEWKAMNNLLSDRVVKRERDHDEWVDVLLFFH